MKYVCRMAKDGLCVKRGCSHFGEHEHDSGCDSRCKEFQYCSIDSCCVEISETAKNIRVVRMSKTLDADLFTKLNNIEQNLKALKEKVEKFDQVTFEMKKELELRLARLENGMAGPQHERDEVGFTKEAGSLQRDCCTVRREAADFKQGDGKTVHTTGAVPAYSNKVHIGVGDDCVQTNFDYLIEKIASRLQGEIDKMSEDIDDA